VTELSPADIHARRTIRLIFLFQALATGSMFARIPDIQAGLGIDEGVLGLSLIGQPVGAILTFLVSSRIIERFGPRAVLLLGIPLAALTIFLMAVAPNPPLLFLVFAFFGVLFALTNVAMNVEADRVEAATGQRLMNSCHGVWSIGQLATVTIGAIVRGLDIPPALHFGIIVPLILIGATLVILPMQPAPARAHTRTGPRRVLSLPTLAILLLVGYAIGASMLEGAVRNWSVIFMRDSFSAPAWVDTLTLPAFIGATVIGRLLADRGVAKFGPVLFARSLGVVSLVGLATVVLAPTLIWALAGFFLIGVGVCVSFPLSTSAAAQLGDRPASENVAAMTMTTQVILLGSPALLGWLAANFGIRASFLVIVPLVLGAIYLAKYLAPQTKAGAR
jgi:MFS family permease